MPGTHKLTINLSDDLLDEIDKFKENTHKPSRAVAVAELIKYALTLPPYFRQFNWKQAEKEADEDIRTDCINSFDSIEDFLIDLKK